MLPVRMLFVKWRSARVCPARQHLPKGAGGAHADSLAMCAGQCVSRTRRSRSVGQSRHVARPFNAALVFLIQLLGGEGKGEVREQGTGYREQGRGN